MITRRCTQRTLLLRPDDETNNAFLYCMALAAQRTAVEVIFFVAMSNHYHAGIVDRDGRLPEFLETFHKLLAKHQNALRGRWENFWASEQTSAVELVGPEDVLNKMVYTLSNPVKDNAVAHCEEWPGATSYSANMRGVVVAASRPSHFFRQNGRLPAELTLTLRRPPGWEHLSERDFAATLDSRLRAVEQAAATNREKTGAKVIGPEAVCRQDWRDRPSTIEPRRNLSPRVASQITWRRREAIQRNKVFVAAHEAARELLLAGVKAVFPYGTYWLRRFLGAICEPCPTPS
jgi:REP-associated tyrosine transposase